MKVYYSVLFFLFPILFFAQEYSVSGTIVNENRGPIAYANVLIQKKADSVFINFKGMSTNDNGVFNFENIGKGEYRISASFLGYKTQIIPFNLSRNETFNIILNEDSELLSEVTLTVNRPTLKKEADRLVFNVANTALSEGNMLELLRSTPGVLVLNNAIQVKNTTPTVYINDRKVHLSNDEITQLLESSPANSIKSIEVITNPSAKYDAESGAVLNIVMDKNLITGYRGNIFTNYTQGVFPRYNVGTTHFYKTKKVSVFANYNYTHNKINRASNEKINFLNNGEVTEKWNTDTNRNTWSNNHNINLNVDYFLDDSNTVSFSSNLLFLPYFKYLTKGNTDIEDVQNFSTSNFDSNNLSRDKKHNLGFDLDFIHESNRSKLSFNAHYTIYDYNRKQDVISDYFNIAEVPFSTAFNTDANQETNIFTTQADHEINLSETSSLSTGAKMSFIKTESYINRYDDFSIALVFNPDLSDAFNYDEDIFAGYISYDKEWDSWSLSGGIRVEQTIIEGKSSKTNVKNNQEYIKWFPTFNLSHKLTENTSIYLNYKRSVQRPNYQDLNPFRYFLNDNTVASGNPDLKPTFIDHVVVGTSINKLNIEAYYKYSDASFLELPIQNNEENQFVYIPTNLNSTIEYGFDFTTYFNMTKNWQIYCSTSFYNINDKADFNEIELEKDTWSNYSEFSNNISFLKDKSLTANFTLIYLGANQQGFQDVESRIATDLTIKKTIFKSKGTLSLAFADLLNEQDFRVTSNYAVNQDNSRYYNQDNRYIKLGFSYKFGNTTLETNERTIDSDELDRLEK